MVVQRSRSISTDNWTVTPTVIYQDTRSHGAYGYDPSVGDLEVQRFYPEYRRDRFIQAALTIEGKLGNWDLTYSGDYLDRKDFRRPIIPTMPRLMINLYHSVGGVAGYFAFKNAAGTTIDPRQNVIGSDHFKKLSQELRVSSPQDERFRIVAGLFYQRQSNEIHQDYQVPGLAPDLSVTGYPGHLVADAAVPRRQGLCDVRRGCVRHSAEPHADGGRSWLHL